jgi:hypothetical protein
MIRKLFRVEEAATARVEALSDGVFAIMTNGRVGRRRPPPQCGATVRHVI